MTIIIIFCYTGPVPTESSPPLSCSIPSLFVLSPSFPSPLFHDLLIGVRARARPLYRRPWPGAGRHSRSQERALWGDSPAQVSKIWHGKNKMPQDAFLDTQFVQKCICGWGLASNPTRGVYSALQDLPAGGDGALCPLPKGKNRLMHEGRVQKRCL